MTSVPLADASARTDPCEHLPVAQSGAGQVSVCRHCQQVHLGLQYMTLRFDTEAFRALVGLLAFSQRRMDSDPALGAGSAGDLPPAGLRH